VFPEYSVCFAQVYELKNVINRLLKKADSRDLYQILKDKYRGQKLYGPLRTSLGDKRTSIGGRSALTTKGSP
jgi:hypothetical protein